jgi:hypothetical protein
MKKSPRSKKKAKVVPEIFVLPSSNIDMENFIIKNRDVLHDSIATAIGYAVEKNLGATEIFKFNKSNYIVLVAKKDYKENLDHIFDCSMKTENYELCGKIAVIRKMLLIPKLSKKQKSLNLI